MNLYILLSGVLNTTSDKNNPQIGLTVYGVYDDLESAKEALRSEVNWYRQTYQDNNLVVYDDTETYWKGVTDEDICYLYEIREFNFHKKTKVKEEFQAITRTRYDHSLNKDVYPYVVVCEWDINANGSGFVEHYLYYYCHTLEAAKASYRKYLKETINIDIDDIPESKYFNEECIYRPDDKNEYYCYIAENLWQDGVAKLPDIDLLPH